MPALNVFHRVMLVLAANRHRESRVVPGYLFGAVTDDWPDRKAVIQRRELVASLVQQANTEIFCVAIARCQQAYGVKGLWKRLMGSDLEI